MSLRHYHHVLRKDKRLLLAIFIFIALGVLATVLAQQCGFLGCAVNENPSLLEQSPIR